MLTEVLLRPPQLHAEDNCRQDGQNVKGDNQKKDGSSFQALSPIHLMTVEIAQIRFNVKVTIGIHVVPGKTNSGLYDSRARIGPEKWDLRGSVR